MIIMIKKTLLFLTLIFILAASPIYAAEFTVEIKDTTVKTDYILMPINGTTGGNLSGKTVEYFFELNWLPMEILSINSKDTYAVKGDNITYSFSDSSRILKVSCKNISSNFTGTLFEINFRLLPYVDFYNEWKKELTIQPKKIRIYSSKDNDTTIQLDNKTASIKIDTIKSNQTYIENISVNYPNPFNNETLMFFSVLEPTTAKAYLYNFAGGIVQNIPDDLEGAVFVKCFDSYNNEIKITSDYKFLKGVYKIVLKANPEKITVGQYRFLFETNKIKSSINISYIN